MRKVLIVDDALYMRLNLKKILFRFGIKDVDEATNGEEAYTMCMVTPYDLVFMDITMPVLDGIEALHKIKDEKSDLKIIMLSAMGDQDWIKKAICEGATEFLLKPFKEQQIKEILDKHLPN